MSVYIAYHKTYPLLTTDLVYIPLHVGKALSSIELGMTGDNTGNHISEKNRNYSELTGLYWMWKNTSDETIGLVHYRRYFMAKSPSWPMKLKKCGEFLIGHSARRFGVHYVSRAQSAGLILTGTELNELLKTYDVIIPVRRKLRYSVYEQYLRKHHISDLDLARQIISEHYASYVPAFDNVMQQKQILHCNMFIMKRDLFNQYLSWLFGILFELEKRVDISGYDNYQKRIFGFLSERLLDVWLLHHAVNYAELPVLYFKKNRIT